ncbi:hypothetical protein SESBI_45013 [Sesbania bispinosa]|nr:hypothetical protein SESBI_45013 [Sesbania bispinosa]
MWIPFFPNPPSDAREAPRPRSWLLISPPSPSLPGPTLPLTLRFEKSRGLLARIANSDTLVGGSLILPGCSTRGRGDVVAACS